MPKVRQFKLISLIFILLTAPAFAEEADPKATSKKEATTTATAPADKSSKSAHINSTITAPIDTGEQAKQDLKHYLVGDELVPMLAGPDEFLTLISESEEPNIRGVVILLPDWQTTSSKSLALNALYKHLPAQGWTTIKIHPLNKPQGYPAKSGTEQEKNDANSKTLEAYQQKLSSIMTQVMDKALNYPGVILIVSQGSNAAQLHAIYQSDALKRPNGFILLSGYMETEPENKLFAQQLAELDMATLDLLLDKDHPLALSSVKLRKIAADKEMKAMYRQRKITTLATGYYPEEKLFTQLNGWLKAAGW